MNNKLLLPYYLSSRTLVEPTRTLFWQALDVCTIISARYKMLFSQPFRQFRILNCNLFDSLKNLPNLFQKSFEYFHRNKS
jgi:hypothetical protein